MPDWLANPAPFLVAIPAPFLLVTPALAVVFANAAAERLLGMRPELFVRDRTLLARRAAEQAELAASVAGVCEAGAPRFAVFRNRQGTPTLAVQVQLAGVGSLVLAVLVALTPARDTLGDVFGAALGLTPTERRLANALAGGDSPTEAARRLGVSITTVRGNLRGLFAKTGAAGLAKLSGFLVRAAQLDP